MFGGISTPVLFEIKALEKLPVMGIPGIFFVFIFGPRLLTLELSARLTFNAFIEIVLIEGGPVLSCFLNNSISCVRTPVAKIPPKFINHCRSWFDGDTNFNLVWHPGNFKLSGRFDRIREKNRQAVEIIKDALKIPFKFLNLVFRCPVVMRSLSLYAAE